MKTSKDARVVGMEISEKETRLQRMLFIALLAAAYVVCGAETSHALWRMGVCDTNAHEFALATNGTYRAFRNDGCFAVGVSDPAREWPYVHPGPEDDWAGSQPHTFSIVFGAAPAATTGVCRLVIDLCDTHYALPPRLEIAVNASSFEYATPAGGSDASLDGDYSTAKPHRMIIAFPAALLTNGNNQVSITTADGSWMVYDTLALEVPDSVVTCAAMPFSRIAGVSSAHALVESNGVCRQPVSVKVLHIGPAMDATVQVGTDAAAAVRLVPGMQSFEVSTPDGAAATTLPVRVMAGATCLGESTVTLRPVRKRTVYILMHSHVDIGYTDIQPKIADRQIWNINRALELIAATSHHPAGSRFKWNLEVFWPADQFLAKATPAQRRAFEDAVRSGSIGIDAMLGNLLTGVCRAEELLRQFTFAAAFGRQCGVTVDSMMISDVPGLIWGVVPSLAQSGVKYISAGPNPGDRIGRTREATEYKPFYWASPSGKEKVLYWGAPGGYAIGHGYGSISACVPEYLKTLDDAGYPYDIVQLRWSKGDNGPADEAVMDQVRAWNATHAWPRLVIATTSEAFHEFEKRYGKDLPVLRGDFTPYWEDGVGSAARETGMNRLSSDRLAQAETLWAMLHPRDYPVARFAAAWRNTAMWSEHTWGAYNSIGEPDSAFVTTQWKYKQAYALDADAQSRALLTDALGAPKTTGTAVRALTVFNTLSWLRKDVVTVPASLVRGGDKVIDDAGRAVPSQRLANGDLVFLARAVPPFGTRHYGLVPGNARATGSAFAGGCIISNAMLEVRIDPHSGAVTSLRRAGIAADLAATNAGAALNEYVYLPGGEVNDAVRGGPVRVTTKEAGPLVASLTVESVAPGCKSLVREIRLVDGLDRVEIINVVDKTPVRSVEGVHFGFGFNVPDCRMRINIPWAVIEPEKDQLAGACRNWFCVERWVDIANNQYGVTWATLEAPLMEIGSLTAHLPRSQPDPRAYLSSIKPSATIYSWVMNNHWHTNYRAEQEGLTTFRYALRPHGGYDAVAAARFGLETSEPLVVAPAARASRTPPSLLLSVEPADVLAVAVKPSDDGTAVIIRLQNVADAPRTARLRWPGRARRTLWLSDALETKRERMANAVTLPAQGMVTLRAER